MHFYCKKMHIRSKTLIFINLLNVFRINIILVHKICKLDQNIKKKLTAIDRCRKYLGSN